MILPRRFASFQRKGNDIPFLIQSILLIFLQLNLKHLSVIVYKQRSTSLIELFFVDQWASVSSRAIHFVSIQPLLIPRIPSSVQSHISLNDIQMMTEKRRFAQTRILSSTSHLVFSLIDSVILLVKRFRQCSCYEKLCHSSGIRSNSLGLRLDFHSIFDLRASSLDRKSHAFISIIIPIGLRFVCDVVPGVRQQQNGKRILISSRMLRFGQIKCFR